MMIPLSEPYLGFGRFKLQTTIRSWTFKKKKHGNYFRGLGWLVFEKVNIFQPLDWFVTNVIGNDTTWKEVYASFGYRLFSFMRYITQTAFLLKCINSVIINGCILRTLKNLSKTAVQWNFIRLAVIRSNVKGLTPSKRTIQANGSRVLPLSLQ